MQRMILVPLVLLSLANVLEGAKTQESSAAKIKLDVAFPKLELERPIFLTHLSGTDRLYVAKQSGRIVCFPNKRTVSPKEVVQALDIRAQVRREHNVEGLLGMAFHPDFEQYREVYLRYSASNPRRTVLSRFQVQPNGLIDRDSEEVILEPEQNQPPHIGGDIVFGPDGYLYVAVGDGGPQHDPDGHGQNLQTWRGSILRIDVSRREHDKPYAIPTDNPFLDRPNAREEVYAFGLRNPWRLSFDPETGTLWTGDVGQNSYEEIDIIRKGGNYGWPNREGVHPHQDGQKTPEMIDPIYAYPRDEGVSITGGYVYRGNAIPSLIGAYVFADYATGTVWSLRAADEERPEVNRLGHVPGPASFGIDKEGEIYLCCFDGKIYKVLPN